MNADRTMSGDTIVANEFGYTPWGMDVVRLAEPTTVTVPNKFLPRARSIARNGGVTLTVEARLVRSTVHRGTEASVTHIEFTPMQARSAEYLRAAVASSVEPDDRIHAEAVAAGRSPAPVIANADCSCSARTTMCVHVFATLYALAMRVDVTPRLALEIQDVFVLPTSDDEAVPDRWTPFGAIDVAAYYG